MTRTVGLEEFAKVRSKRKGTVKKYAVLALFLAPFLLAFLTFFVLPLLYGIYISLSNFKFSAPGFAELNDFKWYRYLLNLPLDKPMKIQASIVESFWSAFRHTLVFSIIMVPVAILLPLTLAVLVNMKPPAYKLFRSLIYLPSIVPLTAAGTVFTLIFMNPAQDGLMHTFFGSDVRWFDDIWFSFKLFGENYDIYYAWIPIFLMCLWGGWGGNFLILSAGLQNVPHNLYEAASIDGCSSWRKILKITIPGIKPQLVLCLFTTIIGYLGLYGQNYVLCSGGPTIPALDAVPAHGQTSTVIYFIQDIIANPNYREKFYGLAAAASLIYALLVGIISGIQQYLTRDKKSGYKKSEAFYQWQRARLQ
jgi:multiple sugar transport system permease protein